MAGQLREYVPLEGDSRLLKGAEIIEDRIARGVCRTCGKAEALPGRQLCETCYSRLKHLRAWHAEQRKGKKKREKK